eukprot:gnl/Ergobibamus_cyprinoides/889.p1 GENE.gnl/Ergobibamus_cyprinoides/889~~gnl/Ergobibamus_cyprinoides/889.p1  ORF type:complete len:312 (+),score=29.99 gnl/Ergobibamus_cyprinoides/889:137-937(+)
MSLSDLLPLLPDRPAYQDPDQARLNRQATQVNKKDFGNPLVRAVIDEAAFNRHFKKYVGQSAGPYQRTALMTAACLNRPSFVRSLIPHEAGMRSSIGLTALMLACNEGSLEAAELLQPHESGLLEASEGATALMTAACHDRTDLVRLMLRYEAGKRAIDGDTALRWCLHRGNLVGAALLLPFEYRSAAGFQGCSDPIMYVHSDLGRALVRKYVANPRRFAATVARNKIMLTGQSQGPVPPRNRLRYERQAAECHEQKARQKNARKR